MLECLSETADAEMIRAAVIRAIQKRTMLAWRRHIQRPCFPYPVFYRLTRAGDVKYLSLVIGNWNPGKPGHA